MKVKKAKWLVILMVVAMLLTMVPVMAFADEPECLEPPAGAEEVTLYAGQDIDVGTVYVWNDADTLYVQYLIDDVAWDDGEGWGLYETHVHVGNSLGDFPLNRGGNPQIGHFAHKATHDGVQCYTQPIPLGDWEADDKLLIAAHAVIEKTECETFAVAPYGGSSVLDSKQGLRYDYTSVRAARSNPDAALTFTTGANEANFFSLGFQEDRDGEEYDDNRDNAWIIIEFDYPILNGPGDDLRIIEDTWGLPYPDETADVWVSQNGTDWAYLGEANNQNPYLSYHTITDFDLENVGLDYARFVKVQDTSNRADFILLFSRQRETLDGFDVNAVIALNDHVVCEEFDETAWGYGTRFVSRGNWATYFSYTVQESERYTLIESVFVPSTNAIGVTTANALESGQDYLLVASGTFTYNDAKDWADAEWYLKNGVIVKGDTEGSVPYVLDVSIDGYDSNIDWGAYNAEHIYEYIITGTGSTIRFFIHDSAYGDNSGGINVDIYKINY